MSTRHPKLIFVAVVLAFGLARPSWAQDERSQTTVVRYIAGPNIYVDLGREDGLAAGDTVYVEAAGRRGGSLRVVSASARKTVLTFAGTPFPIARGDVVRMTYRAHPGEASVEQPLAAVLPAPARQSVMAEAGAPGSRARRNTPSIDGRLSISYQTLSSSTRPDVGSDEMKRSFSTPLARLRMTVRDLPGGFSLHTNAYASYRLSSQESIQPRFLPRLYKLSLSRDLGVVPGEIEIGRFYGPFENFSGYWDGVLLHLGGNGFGGGVASGFQPDRSNEHFAADLPKYMAYMHFAHRLGEGAYSTDISFHSVRPRNELLDHTFLGWRQTWRQGQATFSSEVQADVDPEENAWVLTRLVGRVVVPVGPLRFRAGYSQRRPYSIWRSTGVISYRRDRIDGGMQLVLPGGVVGAGVISNRLEQGEPYLTYTTYFTVPRTAMMGLGFSGSGSYWSRDGYSAVSASLGIARSGHVLSPRATYQYYRTQAPIGIVATHAVNISANLRLSRRMGAHVRSRTQFGELLFSQTYNVGMWVSF